MFEYKAKVLNVIDGDTIKAEVDLGFRIKHTVVLRFSGMNAPEAKTEDGKIARDWLITQLPEGVAILIKTKKDRQEKYGRYLVEIFLDEFGTKSLNSIMIAKGLATKI